MGSVSLPPVLLIPGIGGSILNALNTKTNVEEAVWVQAVNLEQEFRENLYSKYNEETGKKNDTELCDRLLFLYEKSLLGFFAVRFYRFP